MSKEKFVFQWKTGDQAKGKSSGEVSVVSNELFSNARGDYKPHGLAKIRYKAEKLAWQQSRMEEGDWVKRIEKYWVPDLGLGFNGEPFQLGAPSSLGVFKYKSGTVHTTVDRLKPCKPPKEKPAKIGKISPADLWALSNYRRNVAGRVYSAPIFVERPYVEPSISQSIIRVESENFRIENDELVFTGSSMGERAWGSIFTQGCGEVCLNTFDGMKINSEYCKEIGVVLDLYAAMDK